MRGPFGTHWPLAEAVGRDVVIVAGGIGLAPLRSVVYSLLKRREEFGKVVLLYGARTPRDILVPRRTRALERAARPGCRVTVDRARPMARATSASSRRLIPRAPFDPANTIALICGPEVMMRFTVMELQKRGVATERIFVSLERNMKCGIGFCGHCQFGPTFICKDGPVFRFDRVAIALGQAGRF